MPRALLALFGFVGIGICIDIDIGMGICIGCKLSSSLPSAFSFLAEARGAGAENISVLCSPTRTAQNGDW